MVILPIDKKLKKRMHKTIALAQDILVMEIYNNFSTALIHGGTATWRCYGSNRFSEDVDVYLPLNAKRANLENFLNSLKGKGFVVEKFKKTNNSIFAKFFYLGVIVKLEVVFKNIKNFITKSFEMSDGTSILVNTLQPEEMIVEKVSAYVKRKKVRDLYDIFFLLKFVEDEEKVKNALVKLIKEFTQPVDEKDLKVLIISGSVPCVENMLRVMRRWVE
jgi:predicted nucleotidyltransferase component of viral defense system